MYPMRMFGLLIAALPPDNVGPSAAATATAPVHSTEAHFRRGGPLHWRVMRQLRSSRDSPQLPVKQNAVAEVGRARMLAIPIHAEHDEELRPRVRLIEQGNPPALDPVRRRHV